MSRRQTTPTAIRRAKGSSLDIHIAVYLQITLDRIVTIISDTYMGYCNNDEPRSNIRAACLILVWLSAVYDTDCSFIPDVRIVQRNSPFSTQRRHHLCRQCRRTLALETAIPIRSFADPFRISSLVVLLLEDRILLRVRPDALHDFRGGQRCISFG